MANKYFKFVEKNISFFYGIVLGTLSVSLFHKPALIIAIMGFISAMILFATELARKSQSN